MILKANLHENQFFVDEIKAGKYNNIGVESALRMEESVNLLPARITAVEQSLNNEKAQLTKLKNGDFSPSAIEYLAGFLPVAFKTVLTVADGKFTISYPCNRTFTIFARAERELGDTKETYYWLVNAPAEEGSAIIYLSNKNFASDDPDGYLKIKQ